MRRAQPHLGTFVEIEIDAAAPAAADQAIDRAFAAIAMVHRRMSFHDPASDVGRINRAPPGHPVEVHPWTYRVLRAALAFSRQSDGAFDMSVAATLQRLGVLPAEVAEATCPDQPAAGGAAIELLPDGRIQRHRSDIRIDLGGIAKGFAVDRAVATLRACGVASGLVNAGGDARAFGDAPCRIHVRDPRQPRALLGAVDLANRAIASSAAVGGAMVGFDAAGMVIDPRRQSPVSAVRGASIRAPSCMVADALTKVVMVSGEAATALLHRYRAEALLVSAAGEIRVTDGWAPQP